ncbi:MAG: gephyrin-like molybdotransferase Glp, partial [Gemmatimonadales bacterium]
MITPAEAARLIIAQFQPLAPERRPLREALDAVLAEDVASPIDLPPWDNSAMDGYAVRSADLKETGTDLDVIETLPAGQFPVKAVGPGQATRIFTGAPVPQGADTVIRQEDTEQDSNGGRVSVRNTRDAKKNIRSRGEDIRKGAV